jgi:hypothetical protein
MSWARPLDNTRGHTVNPVANLAWFDLLGATLHGEHNETADTLSIPILEENTYGVDESGFWSGGGTAEHVIGAKGKKGAAPARGWQSREHDHDCYNLCRWHNLATCCHLQRASLPGQMASKQSNERIACTFCTSAMLLLITYTPPASVTQRRAD